MNEAGSFFAWKIFQVGKGLFEIHFAKKLRTMEIGIFRFDRRPAHKVYRIGIVGAFVEIAPNHVRKIFGIQIHQF